MQLSYILKEGFSGFKRAKLSMFAAVFTICVSLLLLSFFAILFLNVNSLVKSLREKVEMEAFLNEQISSDQVTEVKGLVEMLEGVREVRYVSKDEAAKIFREEFGEDIYKVLNFNPLPASLKIFLKDGFKTSKHAEVISNQIRSIKGVDDVIYRKQLLEMLDQRAMLFLWITLGIGIFITISSIILVANTIRLAIYAKRKIIQTMKLIGATRSFIRMPFLLRGISSRSIRWSNCRRNYFCTISISGAMADCLTFRICSRSTALLRYHRRNWLHSWIVWKYDFCSPIYQRGC